MVHVPLAVLGEKIKKGACHRGGGDGGCVHELCRYQHIEHIDLVEIDEALSRPGQRVLLPSVACSLGRPARAHSLSGRPEVYPQD